MTGIASTVAHDADLASHPSVLLYDDMNLTGITNRWDAAGPGTLPYPALTLAPYTPKSAQIENITLSNGLPGIRYWARTGPNGSDPPGHPELADDGNEKIIEWWRELQPIQAGARAQSYQRDLPATHTTPAPYEHLFMRYLFVVGSDVPGVDRYHGGKYPGMSGMYNLSAGGQEYFLPSASDRPNVFTIWECRAWYGDPGGGSPNHQLGAYFYGIQSGTGQYASVGRLYGTGVGGMYSSGAAGQLVPGQLHCVEMEIQLNTLVDDNLFKAENDPELLTVASDSEIAAAVAAWGIPSYAYTKVELAMCNNARRDGICRMWLDDVLILDYTNVAYRGMRSVGIQTAPHVNIYQGGHGLYPYAGDEHYDVGAMVVATQYIGPPNLSGVAGGRTSNFLRRRA